MLPFKKSGIYKIINTINNIIYVGSGVCIGSRWSSHKKDLHKNIHPNKYLQHAWNKYGENNFKFEVIELVEPIKEKLITREQYWMDYYKSYERDRGYNINPQAKSCLGVKRGPSPFRGKKKGPQSAETCEKKRLAHLGIKRAPFTFEHIKNRTMAFLLRRHSKEDLIEEIRSCACGCGETFVVMKYKKQRYIAYHATRGKKTWNTGLTIKDPRVKKIIDSATQAKIGKKQSKETQEKKRITYYINRAKKLQNNFVEGLV